MTFSDLHFSPLNFHNKFHFRIVIFHFVLCNNSFDSSNRFTREGIVTQKNLSRSFKPKYWPFITINLILKVQFQVIVTSITIMSVNLSLLRIIFDALFENEPPDSLRKAYSRLQ